MRILWDQLTNGGGCTSTRCRDSVASVGLAHRMRHHGHMSSVSHDEIVNLIGDVDELLVERLMATGASLDEISEAWCDLEDERRFAETPHLATSPRVIEVRTILEEVLQDFDDEDDQLAAAPER